MVSLQMAFLSSTLRVDKMGWYLMAWGSGGRSVLQGIFMVLGKPDQTVEQEKWWVYTTSDVSFLIE
jgi:hypothetical protein